MRRFACAAGLALTMAWTPGAAMAADGAATDLPPSFGDAAPLSTDTGHLQVTWTPNGHSVTLALQRDGEAPRPLYTGSGDTLFVTGLADGDYRLSLSDESGAQTDTLALNVTHQSLSQALWLAALGAVVFLLTIAAILRGARDD